MRGKAFWVKKSASGKALMEQWACYVEKQRNLKKPSELVDERESGRQNMWGVEFILSGEAEGRFGSCKC